MRIIIGGAGEIGDFLCMTFVEQRHDVTLIDQNSEIVYELQNKYTVSAVIGNIQDVNVLSQANISRCDFFLSVTNNTSANILSASIAKKMGAQHVVARTDSSIFSRKNSNANFDYQEHFNINLLIEPSSICASEFTKIIRNPGMVTLENIAFNQIEIQRFSLVASSKWVNHSLLDINTGPHVRVITVTRDEVDTIPNFDTVFAENDIVTIAGTHEGISELSTSVKITPQKSVVGVTIFGSSSVTNSIISYLNSDKYKIRVIEESQSQCEELASKFPNLTVIHGDAAMPDLLTEEQVEKSEYFIACSDDDEKNTMVAIQAKHCGVNNVMLALNYSKYESVINNIKDILGIKKIVAKRIATARELVKYVSNKNYHIITSLSNKNSSFVEFRVDKSCRLIGKIVRNLGLPSGCVLVSLMRNFEAKIPSAGDTIFENDRIVAVVKNTALKTLIDMFSH